MEKQVAIVVGGGQTLWEFLSKGLAEAGYDVLIADINGENAEKVKNEINSKYQGNFQSFQVNATNEEEVINLRKFAEQNEWQDKFNNVPFENVGGSKSARYYQENAVNNVMTAVSKNKTRILLIKSRGTNFHL